jgi:type I restriction enzyme S subunit
MIPAGWERKELGDTITDIKGGGTPSKKTPHFWDGEIPWASVKDITTQSVDATQDYITEAGLKDSASNLIPAGTVIVATRMAVGKTIRFNRDVAINQDLKALFPKKELSSDYLYHWLASKEPAIAGLSSGSTVQGIRLESLRGLELLLPPLPEQKRIAEALDGMDTAIEATKALIEQTKKVKQGLLQTLLTRGIGHTKFKPSPLAEIPESWEVKALEDSGIAVIDGDRGSAYPNGDDFQDSGHCLFLNAKNVTKNGFRFDECQFITEEKHRQLRKGVLERGDLVVTTRGTIGNIASYTKDVPFNVIRINSGMVILRNSGASLATALLTTLLNSPVVESQIKMMSFGSAQQQLTVGILNALNLPIPPLAEQKAIAEIFEGVDNQLTAETAKLTSLQQLKKGLMHDLLTGKVRVHG